MQRRGGGGDRAGGPGENGLIAGAVEIVEVIVVFFATDVGRKGHAADLVQQIEGGAGRGDFDLVLAGAEVLKDCCLSKSGAAEKRRGAVTLPRFLKRTRHGRGRVRRGKGLRRDRWWIW